MSILHSASSGFSTGYLWGVFGWFLFIFMSSKHRVARCLNTFPFCPHPVSWFIKYHLFTNNSQIYVFNLDLPLKSRLMPAVAYLLLLTGYLIGISNLTHQKNKLLIVSLQSFPSQWIIAPSFQVLRLNVSTPLLPSHPIPKTWAESYWLCLFPIKTTSQHSTPALQS